MARNKNEDIIAALVKTLTKSQNGNSTVPDIYRGTGSLPVPQRPGLLTRLFDRTGAMQDEYALKQLALVLETQLKALQIEADGHLEALQLTKESKVRTHAHKLAQHEAVLRKEAASQAAIHLRQIQQNLLAQVAELELDPLDEEDLIKEIIATCMGKPNNPKESHDGNK